MVTSKPLTPDRLARRFQRFGTEECSGRSRLYERLCVEIARDPAVLALAAHARPGQPVPNLFFAAVHYLLLDGASHPLAAFYPDLAGAKAAPDGDPYPAFRSFCLQHETELTALLEGRLVQTAQVRRCASLLPAFELISRRTHRRPLALVEIGASAGLNLCWDRYGYSYSDGRACGAPDAAVQLTCRLTGDRTVPVPVQMPVVASRVGLDLNPIDVCDPEATRWLQALIWPDEEGCAGVLQQAVNAARLDPPDVIAGDALDTLPAALAGAPDGATLCVYHSHTVNQFPLPARQRLREMLAAHAERRDLFELSMEALEGETRLDLVSYRDGRLAEETLAGCDPHGARLEWWGAQS